MGLKNNYNKKINKILKTYNSILVKCSTVPNIFNKNIILVANFDSMINAQIETKKPILYFQEETSISFILLDISEAYIFIIKENDNILNELEHKIKDIEIEKNTFVMEFLSKLENLLLNENNELKYLEINKENESNIEKAIDELDNYSEEKKDNLYLISLDNKKTKKSKKKNSNSKNAKKRKIG